MARLFAPRGITAKDFLQTLENTKLFLDVKEPKVTEKASEKIIARAEQILDCEIKVLPASLYREYFIIGRRTHNGPFTKRRADLFYLFMAEYIERRGRFVEKMVDFLWAIMEESTWMQAPSYPNNSPYGAEYTLPAAFGPDRMHGIDLIAPGTAALLALINTYMKKELDSIDPIVSEKIVYSIKERITLPYLHCPFWWTGEGGKKVNNWGPWNTSNILVAVLLTEENEYVRKRVLQRALNTLDNFVDGYGEDGCCDEGPAYWSAAAGALFDCLEILWDLSEGKVDLYGEPIVRAMGEYVYKMNISGKNYVNFADAAPKIAQSGAFLYRYGEKCGSEYMMSFGKKVLTEDVSEILGSGHPYRSMRSVFMDVTPDTDCKAPTKIWMPSLSVMVLRENEKYDEGLFLAAKGGTNGDSHNHNDVGSFIVYHGGNPVLIDPGAGEYVKDTFSANRYKLWQHQSHYHNLPAFDGVGQHQGIAYAASEVEYNDTLPSLKMQLKDAYEKEAGIVSYVREVGLIDGAIRVTETVELDCEREVDFRYISPVEPKLLDGDKIELAEGRVMTYDGKLTAEIEKFTAERVKAWGEYLWRIHLKKKTKKDNFVITVK